MIADRMDAFVAGSSVVRAMFEESKKMEARLGADNVFDFSLGNPAFPPPPAVRESIERHLSRPDQLAVHGYTNNSGYPDVREKIAGSLNRRFGTGYTADNLIMTAGAAAGLNTILRVLLNPGEEVITFAPYFLEYGNYVSNAGGTLAAAPPCPPDFHMDIEALSGMMTKKTKAVIINSPNNPAGVVYGPDELKALADALREGQERLGTKICLLSDEPYRELAYSGKEVPWAPGFYENTIVCYSFSKSLSLAGERIGYLLIPGAAADSKEIATAANVMTRTLGFVNAPSLMQLVAGDCIDEKPNVAGYEKNRDAIYGGLAEIGYSCVKPEGAFYLFVRSPLHDSQKFCDVAKSFGIVVSPGASFGCEGYFRLAYCVGLDRLERSLPMFRAAFDSVGGYSW